jgi:hypothetical protein
MPLRFFTFKGINFLSMKKSYIPLALVYFLFNCCNISKNNEVEKLQGGLLLESDEYMQGIPLASVPLGGDLPATVDLSASLPPVGHQGQQQSCVAWTIAYALKSYQEKMELGEQMLFSPSFIYNQVNDGRNVPIYMHDALNMLSQQGTCTYNEMPYNENDWVSQPSTSAKTSAKKFRIDFWRRVNIKDVKEVKAQLNAGYPIAIGSYITTEFKMGGIQNRGNYTWRVAGNNSEGSHAMLVVGYDDSRSAFKLMNSWGKEWGNDGFFWMDYNLFTKMVNQGFVAKDGLTDIANTNPNTNPNPTTTIPTTTTPTNPNDFDQLDFRTTYVEHNVHNPYDPNNGVCMRLTGSINIPAAYGRTFQIAVHVYDQNTNQQVKSSIIPTYADVNGFTCGYTVLANLPYEGYKRKSWVIYIPYTAIGVPQGRTYLYAIPTLFVDNFGAAYGERVNFYVNK